MGEWSVSEVVTQCGYQHTLLFFGTIQKLPKMSHSETMLESGVIRARIYQECVAKICLIGNKVSVP